MEQNPQPFAFLSHSGNEVACVSHWGKNLLRVFCTDKQKGGKANIIHLSLQLQTVILSRGTSQFYFKKEIHPLYEVGEANGKCLGFCTDHSPRNPKRSQQWAPLRWGDPWKRRVELSYYPSATAADLASSRYACLERPSICYASRLSSPNVLRGCERTKLWL